MLAEDEGNNITEMHITNLFGSILAALSRIQTSSCWESRGLNGISIHGRELVTSMTGNVR